MAWYSKQPTSRIDELIQENKLQAQRIEFLVTENDALHQRVLPSETLVELREHPDWDKNDSIPGNLHGLLEISQRIAGELLEERVAKKEFMAEADELRKQNKALNTRVEAFLSLVRGYAPRNKTARELREALGVDVA